MKLNVKLNEIYNTANRHVFVTFASWHVILPCGRVYALWIYTQLTVCLLRKRAHAQTIAYSLLVREIVVTLILKVRLVFFLISVVPDVRKLAPVGLACQNWFFCFIWFLRGLAIGKSEGSNFPSPQPDVMGSAHSTENGWFSLKHNLTHLNTSFINLIVIFVNFKTNCIVVLVLSMVCTTSTLSYYPLTLYCIDITDWPRPLLSSID